MLLRTLYLFVFIIHFYILWLSKIYIFKCFPVHIRLVSQSIIFYAVYILRVKGKKKPMLDEFGHKAGYTLDRLPIQRDEHPFTFTFTPVANLEEVEAFICHKLLCSTLKLFSMQTSPCYEVGVRAQYHHWSGEG